MWLFSLLVHMLNTAVFPFKFNTKNSCSTTHNNLLREKKKRDARQREQHKDDKTEDARALLLLNNFSSRRIRVRIKVCFVGGAERRKTMKMMILMIHRREETTEEANRENQRTKTRTREATTICSRRGNLRAERTWPTKSWWENGMQFLPQFGVYVTYSYSYY